MPTVTETQVVRLLRLRGTVHEVLLAHGQHRPAKLRRCAGTAVAHVQRLRLSRVAIDSPTMCEADGGGSMTHLMGFGGVFIRATTCLPLRYSDTAEGER
jgi:hypothetical protein